MVDAENSSNQKEVAMTKNQSLRWDRLYSHLGAVAHQLTRVRFCSSVPSEFWRPAINGYRCQDCIHIYVDLAGVDRAQIHLEVETRRLLIRGDRHPPEPVGKENRPQQILAMEIDCGPFEREITFPWDVDLERVTAKQTEGVLCILLPLRAHA